MADFDQVSFKIDLNSSIIEVYICKYHCLDIKRAVALQMEIVFSLTHPVSAKWKNSNAILRIALLKNDFDIVGEQ